jgi:hypothetical protein
LVKEVENAFKSQKITKTHFWQKLPFFNLRIMLKSQHKSNKYPTYLLRVIYKKKKKKKKKEQGLVF